MLCRSFSAVVSGLHVQWEVAPTENNIKLYFFEESSANIQMYNPWSSNIVVKAILELGQTPKSPYTWPRKAPGLQELL
uniref:Uncharacterized protein n=1 Tax=Anguilla anguilla TaxID=7936 RepID=A0A0E9XKM6_ANGAN